MKKYLFTIFTMLFVFGVTAFADKHDIAGNIAVLDFNKVLMSSPQLEAAKTELKNKFDPRGKELEATQKKFQENIQAFSKNSPTMKAEDKKAAEQKLKDEQEKLQDMQSKFQNDLGKAQNDAMQKIMKKMEEIVTKVAKDKKFDLVIAKSSIAYSKPELDITEEVISQVKK